MAFQLNETGRASLEREHVNAGAAAELAERVHFRAVSKYNAANRARPFDANACNVASRDVEVADALRTAAYLRVQALAAVLLGRVSYADHLRRLCE